MNTQPKGSSTRGTSWLTEDVKDIDAPARHLLQNYGKVPPEKVMSHVLSLRDKAFALYPWPCIGQMRFLRLNLASYPYYPAVLDLLKENSDAILLDVGCCFGQDIRKLHVDGVPGRQLVGLDLVPEFNNLGYELFRDADRLNFDFYARDILNDDADWAPLRGRFDILHLTSFLHIWDWAGQVKAASRLAEFTRSGTLLVGSQLGSGTGGEFPSLESGQMNFRHNEKTFQELWDEVGKNTGTVFKVQNTYFKVMTDVIQQNLGQPWAEPTMGIFVFEVVREK